MEIVRFTTVYCRRCRKPLSTATRSLLGLDALKDRWGILCSNCITPEERHQMLSEQGQALALKMRREVKP